MTDSTWLAANIVNRIPDPAGRIKSIDVVRLKGDAAPLFRLDIEFSFRDIRGEDTVAVGKVYLPPTLGEEAASDRYPLWFNAGYESSDADCIGKAARGLVVANPIDPPVGSVWPSTHPVARGVNLDLALLHIARSLPCVDDTRVILGGGSAGGRIALLLAAETFPLIGVTPDVPPVNWAFNIAYFQNNARLPTGPLPPELEPHLAWITTADAHEAILPAIEALGDDMDAKPWPDLSPVAHIDRITCRVSAVFSTADMLVPVDQVGRALAVERDADLFPPGFTSDPDDLLDDTRHRARLLDSLDPDEVDLCVVAVPEGATVVDVATWAPGDPTVSVEIAPSTKRWSITVVDEGPMGPRVSHYKHNVWPRRDAVTANWLGREIGTDQLSLAKLALLMTRFAGGDWLSDACVNVDYPAAERADVLRSLRTYLTVPGAAARFQELYAQLPPELRALGDAVAGVADDDLAAAIDTID